MIADAETTKHKINYTCGSIQTIVKVLKEFVVITGIGMTAVSERKDGSSTTKSQDERIVEQEQGARRRYRFR